MGFAERMVTGPWTTGIRTVWTRRFEDAYHQVLRHRPPQETPLRIGATHDATDVVLRPSPGILSPAPLPPVPLYNSGNAPPPLFGQIWTPLTS
uniref:Uncharacterized protein n=1 Tax=Timema poppense TaxID=170557 RepID=A0A7R9HI00_TIMPO|nr:unnamed protein product [Timema poppensis]